LTGLAALCRLANAAPGRLLSKEEFVQRPHGQTGAFFAPVFHETMP
jgi:hypothetical protein